MSNSPFNPLISDSAKKVLMKALAQSEKDILGDLTSPELVLEEPAPAPEAANENAPEQAEIPPPAAPLPPANWL